MLCKGICAIALVKKILGKDPDVVREGSWESPLEEEDIFCKGEIKAEQAQEKKQTTSIREAQVNSSGRKGAKLLRIVRVGRELNPNV